MNMRMLIGTKIRRLDSDSFRQNFKKNTVKIKFYFDLKFFSKMRRKSIDRTLKNEIIN